MKFCLMKYFVPIRQIINSQKVTEVKQKFRKIRTKRDLQKSKWKN